MSCHVHVFWICTAFKTAKLSFAYNTIQKIIQYRTHNAMQYNKTQCNTIQYIII